MTRTDDFRKTDIWDNQKYKMDLRASNKKDPVTGKRPEWSFNSNSLSGKERNRMFLKHAGNFADVSLVSGVDDTADGRSFSMLDFDGDGWTDIALMGLNVPRFKLFRNRIGELYPERKAFRFRLVGGNTAAEPSNRLSNRDAVGAKVRLFFKSGKTQLIHKQAGEGFASQNSEVLSMGIPSGDRIEKLTVRWPSGKETVVEKFDQSEIQIIREMD